MTKVNQLNKAFAALIMETEPTFYEMAEVIGKLMVGLFLKTDFDGARMIAFESFVEQIRDRLNEGLAAGEAVEVTHDDRP